MPLLQEVRFVGIKLDEGKKIIPDITWSPNGKNMLFLLENGGGKTSYIQLMLQTILPNTKLSKRDLKDTLAKKSSGHIVTSWKLDGDSTKYLCAGFSYKNAENEKDRLSYYNYLFTYDNESDLNIHTLPLKNENKVTSYHELSSYLRKLTYPNVKIFDGPTSYKNDLKLYGILPEEWESIRKINGEEGGVAAFFDKANTTKTLIEKLLIPTIEETVFNGEGKKEEIIHSYQQYKDNLIKIPELKKDLQDFRVIEEKAEAVVESVEDFTKVEQSLTKETVKFQRAAKTVKEKKEKLTEKEIMLEEEIKDVQKQLHLLGWKESSYEIHKAKQSLAENEILMENKNAEKEKSEEKLTILEKKEKEMNGMRWYQKYSLALENVEDVKMKIDLLTKSEPELQKTLAEARNKLQHSWSYILEEKCEGITEKEKELQSLKSQKSDKSVEIKRIEKEMTELVQSRSKLENVQESYEKEKRELELQIGKEFMLRPSDTLTSYEMTVKEGTHDIAMLKDQVSDLKDKWEHIDLLERDIYQEKNEAQKKKESQEQKKSRYEKEVEKFRLSLAPFRRESEDLFDEKERLLSSMNIKLQELTQIKNRLILEMGDLEKEIRRLDSSDYFVPHDALLDMKNHLEDEGLFVSLGSEWLAEQDLTDEEKDDYLSAFPLLPYSILFEEPQLSLLRKVTEKLKGQISEIPFIFQVKSKMEAKERNSSTNLHTLTNEGTLVFQSLNVELFTSRNEMENMLDELKNNLEQKKISYDDCVSESEKYESALRIARDFYGKFDEGTLSSLEADILNLEGNIRDLQSKAETVQQDKKNIRIKEKELEEQREYLIKNNEELSLIIQKLKSFVERYPNPECIIKDIHDLGNKYEVQIHLKDIIGDEMDELDERIQEEITLIRDKKHDLDAFKLEGQKIGLDEKQESDDIYDLDEYKGFKLTYENAKEQLSGKINELESQQKLLRLYQEWVDDAEKEIKRLHQDLDFLKKNYYMVREEDLNECQDSISRQKEEVEAINESHHQLELKVSSLESKVQTLTDSLVNRYEGISDMAFEYGDNSKEEHAAFVIKLKSTKEKEEKMVQEQRETDAEINSLISAIELTEEVEIGLRDDIDSYEEKEMREFGKNDLSAVKYLKSLYLVAKTNHKDAKEHVQNAFRKYERYLQETNSPKVRKVARDISETAIGSEKMYDVDFVLEVFTRFFDAIESLRGAYQTQLNQLNKDKEELVHLSYQRVRTTYENIIEIPKHSTIELYGRKMPIVKIEWGCESEEIAKANIRRYMDSLLDDIQSMKKAGKTDDEIDAFMKNQLNIIKLLTNLADVEKCKVEIFKPRKETMVQHKVDYYLWDKAASWSGGEGYTSYMAMFMILITHIRRKTTARENVWKTILADNPFGKASSEHVVKPIIELAAKNKIQLFCLTAIKEEGIRSHFDIITSNRYYNHGGVEIMATQHKQGLKDAIAEEMANLTLTFS